MDEAKQQEVYAWLTKGRQDLAAANWLFRNPQGLYNAVGFHCQQAIEKSLKAYLTWHDQPFEKTHSLVALAAQCMLFDSDFESLREAAIILTPYAVTSRYPGDLPELSSDDAEIAIQLTTQAWDFLLARLPSQPHPADRHTGDQEGEDG